MFIRDTPTGSSTTGEQYFTYRLTENVRVEGKVKQRHWAPTILRVPKHRWLI
jgi:hypothetical protein